MANKKVYYATGRRKTSVARVYMTKGKGVFTVNKKPMEDYFGKETSSMIVNAAKIAVTGNKYNDKIYHHHTGYIGNLKSVPFKDLIKKKPEEVIQKAVKGMLPKGPLGREMARKMKVFAGSEHTHSAQQPQVLDI